MIKHYVKANPQRTVHTAVCNGLKFTPFQLMKGWVTDQLFFTTCPECLAKENYSEQDKNRLAAMNIENAWGQS
jgi:hypothetical protein